MEAGKSQDVKATEGKVQAAGTKPASDEDLSMEEILQSIRRIIAEDDKEGKKTDGKANGAKAKAKDEDVPGSDVFELTEMIKDDGSIVNVKAEAAKDKGPADVLEKIDEALTPDKQPEVPPVKAEVKPEPKPAAPPQNDIDAMPASATPPAPVPQPTSPPPAPKIAPLPDTSDSLLSSQAAAASIESLNKLKAADQYVPPAPVSQAPAFRDGTTVEDLVTEMLRPMMKAWLDNNLPQLVERIVEREIRKLTK